MSGAAHKNYNKIENLLRGTRWGLGVWGSLLRGLVATSLLLLRLLVNRLELQPCEKFVG